MAKNRPPLKQRRQKNVPSILIARNWRQEVPIMAAIAVALFILYAYTALPGVGLEDDPIFIASLHAFGISQPPGYPLYSLLGGLFYHLWPGGTAAFKAHLFSGFAAALTSAALYAVIAQILPGRLFAVVGALTFGVSEAFWSQAIIAEVYTLNTFLYFTTMALCLQYARRRAERRNGGRELAAAAFVLGLSLANHWPLIMMGVLGLVLLIIPYWRDVVARLPLCAGLFGAAVVPPYGWMVWRSHSDVIANFAGSIDGWNGFLNHVLRRGYASADSQYMDWENKAEILLAFADDVWWQFTPFGFLLAVLGAVVMGLQRRRLLVATAAVFVVVAGAISLLLGQKATYISLHGYNVFYLPAYGMMAIWLAFGAHTVAAALGTRLPAVAVNSMVALVTVLLPLAVHWHKNNRHDDHWGHELARAKLESVAKNAVLFISGDWDAPVGYMRFVENIRPDVELYETDGMAYGNRLFSPYTHAPQKNQALRQFVGQQERPVYVNWKHQKTFADDGRGADFTGFFWRLNTDGGERFAPNDEVLSWFSQNLGAYQNIRDEWSRQQYYLTEYRIARAANLARLRGEDIGAAWEAALERARGNNYFRVIGGGETLLNQKMTTARMREDLAWLNEFEPTSDPLFPEEDRVFAHYYRARLLGALHGENADYERALRQALQAKPEVGNPALPVALNFYLRQQRHCDYLRTVEEFYGTAMPPTEQKNVNTIRAAGVCP